MANKFVSAIKQVFQGKPDNLSQFDDLTKLSTEQLMALMRHEAHRIEKTIYNDILEKKYEIYKGKWERVGEIHKILRERNVPEDEPTVVWSKEIYDTFSNLKDDFILANSTEPPEVDFERIPDFLALLKARRSVRVWAEDQPSDEEFLSLAHHMIDAARWAPTSGNRQPWRFKILQSKEDKELLRGLKEEHCISAPLVIYVGMDVRVYGALGKEERSIYIDAGAAIMQMVLTAHNAGLGVCWNHFADDLVLSRKSNIERYEVFSQALGIPDYVTPIANVATGRSLYIPPVPARMDIESLLL